MERLALIGVSQRRGGVEALTQWNEWWQYRAPEVSALAEEWVPLLTCNRLEVVLALKGVALEQARQALIPPDSPGVRLPGRGCTGAPGPGGGLARLGEPWRGSDYAAGTPGL